MITCKAGKMFWWISTAAKTICSKFYILSGDLNEYLERPIRVKQNNEKNSLLLLKKKKLLFKTIKPIAE